MTSWYRAMDGKTRRVFWTCSFGWAMDTADGLVFQYLIPVLVAGLGITLAQASLITSANYIAAALGGWLGGWLCDRFGRARILQFTIAWFSFFSFLSGFAHNFHELLAARLAQGIGFGAEWAVGAVLLGEMLNARDRGKVLGVVHSGAASNSWKLCAKPDRKEKKENQAMVNCRMRARPKRSHSQPPSHPPSAAAI